MAGIRWQCVLTADQYRDIKGLNKEQFVSSLQEAPWDCAFVFEDTSDVVDAWYKVFNDIINEFNFDSSSLWSIRSNAF